MNMPGSRRRLVEALLESLKSAAATPDGVAPPVAILWTDADAQWQPIVPVLRSFYPWIYVLGKYDPRSKTGPAIWLKCIVDRTLPEAPPQGETPILYLPRVRRQDLRAAGECPSGVAAAGGAAIPRLRLASKERPRLDGASLPRL